MNPDRRNKISEEIYEKLISAERELKELFVDINKVITLINDIRTVEYTTSVKNKKQLFFQESFSDFLTFPSPWNETS